MTQSPAGIKIQGQALYERQKKKRSLVAPTIIADNLRTPGNISSIYRIADSMNAKQIIFLRPAEENPDKEKNLKRHSKNTTHIKSSHWTYQQLLSDYKSLAPLIALELTDQAENLMNTKLTHDCCFVIGSERYGISEPVLQCCESAIYVPMFGNNGSMNVSHALAICLYEWQRQHSGLAP